MKTFVDDDDSAEGNGAPHPSAEVQQSDRPNVKENPDDRVSGEKNEEVSEPNDDAATDSLEEGDKEDMEVDAINSEVNEQLDDDLISDVFDKKMRSSKRQRVSTSNSPGNNNNYHERRASGSDIKSDVAETMAHLPDNAGEDNVKPTADNKGGDVSHVRPRA